MHKEFENLDYDVSNMFLLFIKHFKCINNDGGLIISQTITNIIQCS